MTMDSALIGASLGASVAVSVAYVANFVAEDFRRFRNGSSLAAALAGELASYDEPLSITLAWLKACAQAVESGHSKSLVFYHLELTKDRVFEGNVGSLGSLGHDTAERLASVYGQLAGFRAGFTILMKHGGEMSEQVMKGRFANCIQSLERAMPEARSLAATLRARADDTFWRWPWLWWTAR